MPTATEFDQAAIVLDGAALQAEQLLVGVRGLLGPDTFRDGRLPLLTDLTIDTAERTASLVSAGLGQQADTCRRRAEVCRAYAQDLAGYRRDLDRWNQDSAVLYGDDEGRLPGPRPRRPRRPASWVEL